MKRIKLFEAFNNVDKIEKLNHLLLYWTFETFVKERIENREYKLSKSKVQICISKSFTDNVCYDVKRDSIIYNWDGKDGWWNFYTTLFYVISRRLDILSDYVRMSNLENVMVKFFKKIYQDEKNKTI